MACFAYEPRRGNLAHLMGCHRAVYELYHRSTARHVRHSGPLSRMMHALRLLLPNEAEDVSRENVQLMLFTPVLPLNRS